MIHHNAFYMFLINTGIVLMMAYSLDKWATYNDQKATKKKNEKNI